MSTSIIDHQPAIQVANTIKAQIGVGGLGRVGARGFLVITADNPVHGIDSHQGGIAFSFTHTTKGGARRVMDARVILTHADDYVIEFWTTKKIGSHRYRDEIKARYSGVYFDTLSRLIQMEAGEFRSEAAPSWEG